MNVKEKEILDRIRDYVEEEHASFDDRDVEVTVGVDAISFSGRAMTEIPFGDLVINTTVPFSGRIVGGKIVNYKLENGLERVEGEEYRTTDGKPIKDGVGCVCGTGKRATVAFAHYDSEDGYGIACKVCRNVIATFRLS